MNIEEKVNQLIDLLTEFVPVVITCQRNADENISKLAMSQSKTNLAMGELRQSTMRLVSTIEKLIVKKIKQ